MNGSREAIRLSIKVIPRAKSTEVRGRMADGTLKIALKAPPSDGRANDELVAFLAGEFGTGRSSVSIVSGARSRKKRISIASWTKLPPWMSKPD